MTQVQERTFAVLLGVALAVVAASSVARAGGSQTVPRCRVSELQLQPGAYGEAALQFTQTLTFVNRSRSSCRLAGWPSVNALGRARAAKTLRVVQGAPGRRPYSRVLLTPSGAASFDLYGADWDTSANRPCPRTSTLGVAPPGVHAALRVRLHVPDCGRFYVAPLIPGRRDRAAWSVVWRG
jgi:Protein of unknown function (DUF4232)